MRRLLLATVAVMAALLLQLTLVDRLPSPGGPPDLVLLVTVALGLTCGPTTGLLTGFWAGLALDIAPPASALIGGRALVFCLIGYCCGLLRPLASRSALTTLGVAAVAAATGEALYAAAGLMLGSPGITWPAIRAVLPASVLLDVLISPFLVYLVLLAAASAHPEAESPLAGAAPARARVRSPRSLIRPVSGRPLRLRPGPGEAGAGAGRAGRAAAGPGPPAAAQRGHTARRIRSGPALRRHSFAPPRQPDPGPAAARGPARGRGRARSARVGRRAGRPDPARTPDHGPPRAIRPGLQQRREDSDTAPAQCEPAARAVRPGAEQRVWPASGQPRPCAPARPVRPGAEQREGPAPGEPGPGPRARPVGPGADQRRQRGPGAQPSQPAGRAESRPSADPRVRPRPRLWRPRVPALAPQRCFS